MKSNIEILSHYIKANATPTPIVTAAKIDLLIFMQKLKMKNFAIDWDDELTE